MLPISCGQGNHLTFAYNQFAETPCSYYGGSFASVMYLSYGGFGSAPSGGTPGWYLPLKWGSPGSWVDGGTNDLTHTWGDVNNMRCFGLNPNNPGYTTVPANMWFMGMRNAKTLGTFSGMIKYNATINGRWSQPAQKSTGACVCDIRMIIQRPPPPLGTGGQQFSGTLCRIRMEHSGWNGVSTPINSVSGTSIGIVPTNGLAEGTNAGQGIPTMEDGDVIAIYAVIPSQSFDGGSNYNYFDIIDLQCDLEFLANP